MAEIISFTYRKDTGETSNRQLVPFTKPSRCFSGVDISELSEVEQALYMAELNKVREEYRVKLAELADKFDLNHRYRQFVEDRMTNLKTEQL